MSVLDDLLAAHAGVTSTAAWAGSPNPHHWRNIRRVCKCGAVIGWHKLAKRGWQPLSGYAFDEPHRAHIAEALAAHLAAQRPTPAAEPPCPAP